MNRMLVALILTLFSLGAIAHADRYAIEVVADELENPWSVAFLPEGGMLVTERPGRLRWVDESGLRTEPISGLPPIFASGQAGLFDVLLAEDYSDTGHLYLSFAYGDDDANRVRIIRARFDGEQLHDVTAIFTAEPSNSGDVHYGGRMAWMQDGTLIMGTGDGFFFREESQNLNSHHGKIIRLQPDGSVPEDNPFVDETAVRPEIYSYGHRNVQAIVVDPDSGAVYAHEHGPRGGDELNLIRPGLNYGWPLISYGRDYSRALITPFTELPEMEQPLLHWTPSISPSGMTLYDGSLFPDWQGSLFVAALAEKSVRRIPAGADGRPIGEPGEQPGEQAGEQEILFTELEQRIRDVRTGPDGALYLLTDEAPGQLLRVIPQP